jgi:hypothetical protein
MVYTFITVNKHGLFGSEDMEAYDNILEQYYYDMQRFIQEADRAVDPHLYVMALDFIPIAGMASYPNFNVLATKSLDHPDLFPLAILAEKAHIDIRFVVLLRSA